ncbi:MAG: ATP-dependent metallopeptidase FtsH/Yme1/Tma family protein [Desulfobacterales bacterium]
MDNGKLAPPKTDPEKEQKSQQQRHRRWRFSIGYVVTSLIALWLFQEFILTPLMHRAAEIPYSEFKQKLAGGKIIKAVIRSDDIVGEMKNPKSGASPSNVPFNTVFVPASDPNLVEELQKAGVSYSFQRPPSPVGGFLLSWLLPLALLGGFGYVAYRRVGASRGGRGGIFGVGRSKAIEVKPEQVGVTFKDVGGADEAIAELHEIIEFLKAPEHFAKLGGRIPKGVLLVGPPGTGKTLLAKATAGEAQVAFFETSGSEFIEMFVGVGAARVRDLFEQARRAAPAIIFIDEIDAIGQSRAGAVRMGGNDEREQTLNQLLTEIDGFKTSTVLPVIIMAATNRPETLDPRKAEAVALEDFETAIERVVAGLEKKSRVMNEQERTTVAYHESGHALVAELVPHGDPVSKISIVPHSRGALGYTMQMPTEDRYLLSVNELQDRLAVMLGGRAAEKVVFNIISTGASDDIMRATELARRMVTEFGMSEKLGSVSYSGRQLQYLGGAIEDNSRISPETRQVIDNEVQRIVTTQYERAQAMLKEHQSALETLARQLLKQETVDGSMVKLALGNISVPADKQKSKS